MIDIEITGVAEFPDFPDAPWYKELQALTGRWLAATPEYAKKLRKNMEVEFDASGALPEGLSPAGSQPLSPSDLANKAIVITKVDRQRGWLRAGIKWRDGYIHES